MINTITIMKRNGQNVPYNGEKIVASIYASMIDADVFTPEQLNTINITETMLPKIEKAMNEQSISAEDGTNYITVEKIQDIVELALMESYPKASKEYILYRNRKERERKFNIHANYKFLNSEFLSNYKHKKPPLTDIGFFTYLRTYARYIPELERREDYWEMCARAVEYNMSLVLPYIEHDPMLCLGAVEEAETLYDAMFNCKLFLSGRQMFTGGTPATQDSPLANFNCSYMTVDGYEVFGEALYLLTLGVGVGIGLFKENFNTKNFPTMRNLKLTTEYNKVPKKKRLEDTELSFFDNSAILKVGDSRTAFRQLLDFYFDIRTKDKYRHIAEIIVDFGSVRPAGEPIKRFGGLASGHEHIMEALVKIHNFTSTLGETCTCNPTYEYMTTIKALDICTSIAEFVVSGNVRRSK